MAAKLFLLLIAIGQAMGQLKLNCHIVPESLSQLFDNSTRGILQSCDRLIVIAGTPLKDGKLRSMGESVKGHMQNARNTNPDIELLVEVFLRPEHMQPLVNDDYRANLAQSLKDLVLANDLKGAVVNVDHNYERAEPHVRGKAMIISLLSRVRSHLGQSGVLGLVTGTRGPFDTVEPKNCHNMSPNLDFIELSPESFDLDGRREPKGRQLGHDPAH
ncbi:hypothetical protein HDE_03947 [Halotydeus destructor]|nr:hypothetical protein HDE_03947 [Halotydeus destructor]